MNYLKLVNFELGRFIKIYFVLMGITIVSQLTGTVLRAKEYLSHLNEEIVFNGLTTESFVDQYGQMSLLNLQSSPWFNLPILFAAATLILYCFFIWYRDWFGKNTFIYRLLMLPTARINIYLSKATAIFLMVLGLVALQVILLIVEGNILKWMVPANVRLDLTVMDFLISTAGNMHMTILIPPSFTQFLIHYAIGFMVVFVVFTSILFERSFRLKGIFYGILYAILAFTILFLPFVIEIIIGKNYLFPIELMIVELILWAIVTAMSIWVSHYLLNKKITV